MNQYKTLKLIKGGRDIKDINDENLANKDVVAFDYSSDLSNNKSVVFLNNNISGEIKTSIIFAIVFVLILFAIFYFWQPSSTIGLGIAGTILLSGGIYTFGAIVSIFSIYKKFTVNISENTLSKITIETNMGKSTEILDLRKIANIKLFEDEKKSYFTLTDDIINPLKGNTLIFAYENNSADEAKENITNIFKKNITK